ncbi:hypothetical protein [Paenibacillus sp. FSL P4-0081]|uniref:hypothetical protein n=1 Tax=Paenibacillus sp. FSL P4-0081 TaxID=1536769 RepID=UPI000AE4B9D7|nr:hypothetical protein [Paenibacillus sp. FSL P4-0081]
MIKRFIRRQIIRYIRRHFGSFEQDSIHVVIMSKQGYWFFRNNVNQYLKVEEGDNQ